MMASQAALFIALLVIVHESTAKLSMNDISKKTTITHFTIDKGEKKEETLTFDPDSKKKLACSSCNTGSIKSDFIILAFGFKVDEVLAKGREWADAYMAAQADSRSGKPVELILLDWNQLTIDAKAIKKWGSTGVGSLVSAGYQEAAHNAVDMGGYVGYMIKSLVTDHKVDSNRIQLIGEGLAAHMMGVASRFDTATTKPGRITGLDPVGPFFDAPSDKSGFAGKFTRDTVLENSRLKKTDGKFVDVIHTNGVMQLIASGDKSSVDLDLPGKDKFGDIRPCSYDNKDKANCARFGDLRSLGHVDFYVGDGEDNIARIQPECDDDGKMEQSVCSHTYARKYYLATIKDKSEYYGYKCKSLAYCLMGTTVDDAKDVYMGNEVRREGDNKGDWEKLSGSYYVKVSSAVKGWVIAVAVIVTILVIIIIIAAVVCVRKKNAGGGGRDMSDMGGAASYQNTNK